MFISMSNCSTIWTGGHIVGEVKNGTFRKSIYASRHLLRKPPAICLSVDSLNQAEAVGAKSIEVKDKETGRVYTCTVTHFKQYAFDMQRGGYEAQKALPLSYWNVSGGTVTKSAVNVTPSLKHESTDTPAPEYKPTDIQLSLFAGM